MVIGLSIGLPGRFSAWCDAAVAAVLGSGARIETVPSLSDMFGYGGIPASLDAIARCLIAADAPHLVMGLRQPDERLRLALAETGVRFVVALDLPIRAVADLLETTDADPIRAVRAVANSCAAVMRFPPLPGALLLHADATRAAPDVAITALASHLGAALDEAEPARIAARLATNPPHAADSEMAFREFSETARHTMQAALSGYQECFAGQGMGQLVWSRDLFLAGSGDERAGDILELAGGARILVVGPYMHIPPGSWTARIYLGVSPEAAGCPLLIEAYAGAALGAARLEPVSGGIFTAEMNIAIGDTCERPVEFRISVAADEAAGRLAFGRVVLQPATMRRPDAVTGLEELTDALGL